MLLAYMAFAASIEYAKRTPLLDDVQPSRHAPESGL